MKDKLFIPKKIKVGFNLRLDTYSGKLGYVICHDGKVWRKETSWESWRQKDGDNIYMGWDDGKAIYKTGEGLEPLEFENVPTEGFVLNKGVGGVKQSYGWNARNEYIRIYDPRGFEFEISVANLLFILAHTNAYKGKGLEGNFIYSWEGKELVLLPADCEEYKKSVEFTDVQDNKVSAKTLIVGGFL